MRAYHLTTITPPTLTLAELPAPTPGPGELLIRIHAAGVTPTELLWYPTTHTKTGEPRPNPIPGHEFSGTIAALGADTPGLAVGQDIFGMNDWFADGATADFCITRPEWIAPKPRRLSHAEAAAVPIGALTAWQGLFDRAKLQPGERILIHGGAGAVGAFAVQLAHHHGAYVLATASPRNTDFLKSLGANEVIDYHTTPFDEHPHHLDVVFDTVGGDTLQRSWPLLRPTGRLVTIAADSEGTADERTKKAFFIVEPRHAELVTLATLLDTRALLPTLDTTLPFTDAPLAYTATPPQRRGRGKTVLTLIP